MVTRDVRSNRPPRTSDITRPEIIGLMFPTARSRARLRPKPRRRLTRLLTLLPSPITVVRKEVTTRLTEVPMTGVALAVRVPLN